MAIKKDSRYPLPLPYIQAPLDYLGFQNSLPRNLFSSTPVASNPILPYQDSYLPTLEAARNAAAAAAAMIDQSSLNSHQDSKLNLNAGTSLSGHHLLHPSLPGPPPTSHFAYNSAAYNTPAAAMASLYSSGLFNVPCGCAPHSTGPPTTLTYVNTATFPSCVSTSVSSSGNQSEVMSAPHLSLPSLKVAENGAADEKRKLLQKSQLNSSPPSSSHSLSPPSPSGHQSPRIAPFAASQLLGLYSQYFKST